MKKALIIALADGFGMASLISASVWSGYGNDAALPNLALEAEHMS